MGCDSEDRQPIRTRGCSGRDPPMPRKKTPARRTLERTSSSRCSAQCSLWVYLPDVTATYQAGNIYEARLKVHLAVRNRVVHVVPL